MADLTQGGSRWAIRTPSPKLVKADILKRYREQLQAGANAELPNEEALTTQLLGYDLPQADILPIQNVVRQNLAEYLEEYRKNPYYAFTPEARNKKKTLQRIVSDPRLKQLQEDFANAKKTYENVRYDLGSNLNYQDGYMDVIDKKTTQRTRISPDNFNPERYRPLTVDDSFEWLSKYEGLSRRADPFSFNMTKPQDIRTSIRNHFAGLGQKKRDEINEVLKTTVSSNQESIEYRKRALMEAGGLTEADWNTLKSEIFTKNYKTKGTPGTEQEATQQVFNYINDIAQGYSDSSVSISKSPIIEAKKDIAELKGKETLDMLTAAYSGAFGTSNVAIGKDRGDRSSMDVMNLEMRNLPTETLYKSRGVYEQDGQKVPKLNAADMEIFTGLTNNPLVFNSNTGGMSEIPDFANIAPEVVINPKRQAGFVTMLRKPDGTYMSPQEAAEFTKRANTSGFTLEDQGVIPVQMMTVEAIIPRGEWGAAEKWNKVSEVLNESGKDAVDLGDEEEWYNNNIKKDAGATGKIGRNPFKNDHYVVSMYFPVPSAEAIRFSSGQPVKTETETVHAETMNVPNKPLGAFNLDPKVREAMLRQAGYKTDDDLN